MWSRRVDSSRRPTSHFGPVIYIGLVILLLIVGFASYQIYDARKQTDADVRRDLTTLSNTSADQLKDYMDAVSQVLSAAVSSSRPVLSGDASAQPAALKELRASQIGSPVSLVIVVGSDGRPVLSTSPEPSPVSTDTGVEALRELSRKRSGGLALVGPVRSVVNGLVETFAAQAVIGDQGRVLGAVLTPLEIRQVQLTGEDASAQNAITFSVYRADNGKIIAQFPDPGSARYLRDAPHDYVVSQLEQAASGFFRTAHTVDGADSIFAFHRLVDFPLISVASMKAPDVSSLWRVEAMRIILISYCSIMVVGLLLLVIHRQLRQLVSRSKQIARSEQRFDRVIQNLTDAIYVRDRIGKIIVANREFARFFDVADERSIIGRNISEFHPSLTTERLLQLNDKVLFAPTEVYSFETDTVTPLGTVPIEYILSAVEIAGEQFILGQMRDISARRTYETQLVRQATYDEITGLPNRRLYMDRLTHALHRTKREGGMVCVMFIDLDHFKRVNDTLGHPVGDQLLTAAARRIESLVSESDTVARFGGDEFVILIQERRNPVQCRTLAADVVSAFQQPFDLAGRQIAVTASVGVAVSPTDGFDADLLLQHADTAMYEAKAQGRSAFVFFNHEMNARVHETLQIDEQIRLALPNGELSVVYQPIIDPVNRSLVKAEALARWSSRVLGKVPPDKFIPIAEENGLISQIGAWVMKQACKSAAGWRTKFSEPVTVSVNVSAKQFGNPNFLDTVRAALDEAGLPPHLLELEITESILISDDDASMSRIHALRQMGVGLSLDDFGTGYSSLSYLTRFPLNTIKIDRSFVKSLDVDPQTQNLTRAIIAMAKSLDLKLVAEGVETHEQVTTLVEYGCEYLQGFYFGRPMSDTDIVAFRFDESEPTTHKA